MLGRILVRVQQAVSGAFGRAALGHATRSTFSEPASSSSTYNLSQHAAIQGHQAATALGGHTTHSLPPPLPSHSQHSEHSQLPPESLAAAVAAASRHNQFLCLVGVPPHDGIGHAAVAASQAGLTRSQRCGEMPEQQRAVGHAALAEEEGHHHHHHHFQPQQQQQHTLLCAPSVTHAKGSAFEQSQPPPQQHGLFSASAPPPPGPSSPVSQPGSLPAVGVSHTAAAPGTAGRTRAYSSDAELSRSRFSDRIRGCEYLNQLILLYRACGHHMKASHMALASMRAVELRQGHCYLDMSDFDALMLTQVLVKSIAKRVQVEACTVAELELLLCSWARLKAASSKVKNKREIGWDPPAQTLQAVIRRLKPDPQHALPASLPPSATRLSSPTFGTFAPSPPLPPQLPQGHPHPLSVPEGASSTHKRSHQNPLSVSEGASSTHRKSHQNPFSVSEKASSNLPKPAPPSDRTPFAHGAPINPVAHHHRPPGPHSSTTKQTTAAHTPINPAPHHHRPPGPHSSITAAHAPSAQAPQPYISHLLQHNQREQPALSSTLSQPYLGPPPQHKGEQPAHISSHLRGNGPDIGVMTPSGEAATTRSLLRAPPASSPPSASVYQEHTQDACEADALELSLEAHTVPYGNKLNTASCSSLAAIGSALRRLGCLDDSLRAQLAQLTCKKAKHGSLPCLAMLAYVLRAEGWQGTEAYSALAQAAVPKMSQAPDPMHVASLLKDLSEAGVRNTRLLAAVAEDVSARGGAYARWAPRIARVFADAGYDHHLLFEALASVALQQQGEMSLGCWGLLLSSFAELGKQPAGLAQAACHHASVPLQSVLIELGEATALAACLHTNLPQKPNPLLPPPSLQHRELRFRQQGSRHDPLHEPQLSSAPAAHLHHHQHHRDQHHLLQQQQQQQQQQRVTQSHHARVFHGLLALKEAEEAKRWQHYGLSKRELKRKLYWDQYHDRKRSSSSSSSSSSSYSEQHPHPAYSSGYGATAPASQPPHQNSMGPTDHLYTYGASPHHQQSQERQQPCQQQHLHRLRHHSHHDHHHHHQQQQQHTHLALGLSSPMDPHPGKPEWVGALRGLQGLDVREPERRLKLMQCTSLLLQGLGRMGHYDRDFVSLACLSLRSLCYANHGFTDGKALYDPSRGWLLASQDMAHSMTQAITALAQLRHKDSWIIWMAVQMLDETSRRGLQAEDTAAAQTADAQEPETEGYLDLQPRSPHSNTMLQQYQSRQHQQHSSSTGSSSSSSSSSILEQQQQQALQLLQLLQALAILEGPGVRDHAAFSLDASANAGADSEKRLGQESLHRGKLDQQREQPAAAAEEATPLPPNETSRSVLTPAVQLLARAHTAFSATQLCDMLDALALLEVCPWRELVQPALNRLADLNDLKPRTVAAPGGGPASMALSLVQALIHGGYSPDKLGTAQKVNLYQMYLVAEAAGWKAEFKDALGSWDAVRDARAAWHAALPRMHSATRKALRQALTRELRLPGTLQNASTTRDGSIEFDLCLKAPESPRQVAFQVLTREQCTAHDFHAHALGPARWLMRCLAWRGVDCVTLTRFEYEMATDREGVMARAQKEGFVLDHQPHSALSLPQLLSRKLLSRKFSNRHARRPLLPPIDAPAVEATKN